MFLSDLYPTVTNEGFRFARSGGMDFGALHASVLNQYVHAQKIVKEMQGSLLRQMKFGEVVTLWHIGGVETEKAHQP